MEYLTDEDARAEWEKSLASVRAVIGPDRPGQGFKGPLFIAGSLLPWWLWQKTRVLMSVDVVEGQRWLHASVSGKKKMPTHPQLSAVRNAFFRPTSVVVAIYPPASEYVNLNPYVLHLWERLDGPRLVPDMRKLDIFGYDL